MRHPRRWNLTTSVVGLKKGHIRKKFTQNGGPERCSWGTQKKKASSFSLSSLSYARRRCGERRSPGCHRACPSVVSVLATCPASEHHVVGSAVVDVTVMMLALYGHISDSPTLNLLYMWALSLLCPVLSLNRTTCSGLFSLWRLSDWLELRRCCFHFFLERVFMMVFSVRPVESRYCRD